MSIQEIAAALCAANYEEVLADGGGSGTEKNQEGRMSKEALSSEHGTYPTPEHGWVCFHCGEHFPGTFAGHQAARHHFGDGPIEDAACQVSASQFRATQDMLRRYQSEDTDLHREISRMQADHAVALRREEEKGYARGLEDAKRYPSSLGLATVTETENGGRYG